MDSVKTFSNMKFSSFLTGEGAEIWNHPVKLGNLISPYPKNSFYFSFFQNQSEKKRRKYCLLLFSRFKYNLWSTIFSILPFFFLLLEIRNLAFVRSFSKTLCSPFFHKNSLQIYLYISPTHARFWFHTIPLR